MIGHVSIGASIYHLLSYVLEDKKELSEEKKLALAASDHLQHSERAEVLEYNKCFGNKYELTEQFKDVSKLSSRIEKTMLHLSLRLAPGEQLTKAQLTDMGRACAKAFGVADHQYICVLHKDTKEQHIHVAANRVGFDGKVATDSNSYKRMAELCRKLEKQCGLQQVLSPRKFLSATDRQLPRHDSRKEKLKADIQQTLKQTSSYPAFEKQMKGLGYKILKGRGISFVDDKKVKFKGSEVGFSLTKIERILSLQQQLDAKRASQKNERLDDSATRTNNFKSAKSQQFNHETSFESVEKQITGLLGQLLTPEYTSDYRDPELIRQPKKKRKPGMRH
ncbi:relaxase/mobilization nuclease domain-containing protein [Flavobacterium psychrotrophum]|uniref:relaxase/mobilization nuclease domain-containing protein n=1 Tax=Flavobacterium psychrotrophum TaxID=2294119 RepID=UPI000E30E330|nr:relaxase/mobilization nuclease domain-containing protein [Flavobacterium psychrotrophum]